MPGDAAGEGQAWRPNLFVPGFPKCGTTALCDYLRQHPDIYVTEPKEPNTLAIGIEYPYWKTRHSVVMRPFTRYLDLDQYETLFKQHREFRYRAEGSQAYIYPPHFPARLRRYSPGAKLIFMIRDQRERLLSMYFHGFKVHLDPDFKRWTETRFRPQSKLFLFEGMLSSYHRLYGDSMRVIDNRSLLQSPGDVMRQVFEFLGLREVEVSSIRSNVGDMKRLNEYQRRRVAPYLRLTKTVMSPVKYFFNTADPATKGRLRRPAGRLSLWRWTETKTRTSGAKKARRQSGLGESKDSIPEDLGALLDEDYSSTLEFCRARNLLL